MSTNRFEEIEIISAPAPPIALKSLGNLVVNAPQMYGMTETLSPITVLAPRPDTLLSHPGYMGTILITTPNRDSGITDAFRFTPLGYQVSRNFTRQPILFYVLMDNVKTVVLDLS